MKDKDKTKEQLIKELSEKSRRIEELEMASVESNKVKIELQSSNAILQSLVDSTDDATLISDRYARPVLWNKAYARTMKDALSIDMRKGLQPHKLLKDEEVIAWWDNLHKRVLSGESFRVEYSHDFGKGDIKHFEISYNPIFKDGEITGFSEFTRDITDRKTAMELSERSENKYRTLLNNIPQKIFYKDINSMYMLCNESYAKDLKIEPSEIIGKTDCDFYPKELAEKYINDDKEIMDSGKISEIEEIYVADGKEMTVNTLKAPLLDNIGKTIGIFGIFWDITDRKNTEEALQRAHDELEQRVKERTLELQEKNTTLKVLMEQRIHDKTILEEQILSNFDSLISPHLKKLEGSNLSSTELALINVIDSNLREIISPFSNKLSSKKYKFTNRELEIANLIKVGKKGKDIAEILNLSLETVNTFRKTIRNKLEIQGEKVNLRSVLLSIAEEDR